MKRLLFVVLALAACDDGDTTASARFALAADAAFFRLRIFETAPTTLAPAPKDLFDTGCLQQQSRTYELTNIPVGQGYTVVYEGFSDLGCATRVALGFRGGVGITEASELPYYHVQVYPAGDVATLPEEINLSASVARAVDFCEAADDCGASEVCYDAAKPEYWCVPSCTTDADCKGIHVRASCDADAGWCTLRSPFPLNLSEPRAFGAAVTLPDGDVLFVGGLRQDGVGALLPTMHPLERFDAASGLFVAAGVEGQVPPLGGDFGFAALGPSRFVTVGGFVKARVAWSGSGLGLSSETDGMSDDVIVWDTAAGTAKSVALPRTVARSAVVRLADDRFFIAGGLVLGGSIEPSRLTSLCTVSDGAPVCEPGPMLVHPRQGAAAACLDAECSRVLIVGGNPSGTVAEVVDLTTNTASALETNGMGNKVFSPILCGLDLVGGSGELARASSLAAVRLSVSGSMLTATPIANAPTTTYMGSASGVDPRFGGSGECFVAGGLASGEGVQTTSNRIVRVTTEGASTVGPVLGRPRFGAVAAKIGSGLLAGSVLFAGGVTLDGEGPVKVVRGAEVLTP